MRIAVDIGGTFTDLVAVDDDGQVFRSKALTTPDDLARGIDDCLTGANVQVAGANFFVHGSTVTINAVLERKGARTGLDYDQRISRRLRDRPRQPAGRLQSVFQTPGAVGAA